MSGPYIPTKDADVLSWSTNFDTLITATPTAYGLTAPQALVYAGLHAAFAASYAAAVAPSTRTIATVATKDTDKFDLLAEARLLANVVQAWPSITPTLLADLGLTVRDVTPTPIAAPTTFPILSVVAASMLAHIMRYADELTPAARKKPFGAIALELWKFVGTTIPAGPEGCSFHGDITKNPAPIAFGSGDGGKLCTYYARWTTRRGLVGPWSAAVTLTVPTDAP